MGMIFIYHCNRFFNTEDWHIKNPTTYATADTIEMFMVVFIIPLFFILSGISTRYSLQFRDAKTFVVARIKRLVVPLIFGIFVLSPPQIYLERLTHGETAQSFIGWFPHYFEGLYFPGEKGNFAWMGVHLWYLLILFLFSLLTLPVFLRWMGKKGRVRESMAHFVTLPSGIILVALPFIYLGFMPMILDEGVVVAGWNFSTYLFLFIWGYLLASDQRYQDAVRHHAWAALIIAVATSPVWFTPMWILKPLSCWAFMIAFLGLGQRYLQNRNNRYLKYGNEAVLPFYILHQPIILIVGYYVIQWNLVWPLKFAVIATVSFILIMTIYEALVRRWNPIRFLFGLKMRRG
jgi:glucan biosynthesis protein C